MKTEKVKYMLLAQNMSRAIGFYRDVFGFQSGFFSDHWSEVAFGDAIVAFHEGADGSSRSTNLSIQVDDASAAVFEIEAAGGKVISPPIGRDGEPILLGTFRDPEGNEVMLTQMIE